jgi:ribonuclease HI
LRDRKPGGLFPSPPHREPEVILFTDGACSGNPGPGGWAYILRLLGTDANKEESGADPTTTNNQMELMAVIQGLKVLKRPTVVKVVTDSSYVEKGLSEWMHRWKNNHWRRKTSSGYKSVKNLELWQELDRLDQFHTIVLQRVRGHAGHPENERCDELAVAAYRELMGQGS